MKAVVVLSGGQDSATCLALAIRRYGVDEVAAITFSYGQLHVNEVKFAKRLLKLVPQALTGDRKARIPLDRHRLVRLDFYRQLTTNALLDPSVKIERKSGAKCPTTVVEGRNAVFLQLAAVWAKSLGATDVYTGVSEADFSGYPDCRADFIRAEQKALRLALDYPIRIVTPFLHKSKAEEWALADRLGILDVIRNQTVTCYRGVPGAGCGTCPACKLRNRGYAEFLSRRGK